MVATLNSMPIKETASVESLFVPTLADGVHLFTPDLDRIRVEDEVLGTHTAAYCGLWIFGNATMSIFRELDEDIGTRLIRFLPDDEDNNLRRTAACMAAVLESTATDVAREHGMPRHERRRKGMPPLKETDIETEIAVVTWRKRYVGGDRSGTGEGYPIVDKHWWVRGHFRMQPCGPERSQRKLIYIEPFIKGDPDMPLHDPVRINAVVR